VSIAFVDLSVQNAELNNISVCNQARLKDYFDPFED